MDVVYDSYEELEYLGVHEDSNDTLSASQEGVPALAEKASGGLHLVSTQEKFWYTDGNVVLIAGDTRFKVYQGLLSARSPVLARLFHARASTAEPDPNVAEGLTSEDAPDGCFVVRVSDSPEDLRHLLRLYMPRGLAVGEPTFEMISAYIRLGLKYQIRQLSDAALALLKDHYTDNFDHWDSARICMAKSQAGFGDIHAIGVVNLARLTGELSLLPVALWRCCRLGSDLVYGYTREDGTRETLTFEDLGLCFAAQEKLIQAGVRARLRIFSQKVAIKCQTSTKCKEVLAKACRSLEKKTDLVASTDLFVPYTRICGALALCVTCLSEVKARDKEERRAMWKRLPSLLGIVVPGWGDELE
ncbi:hypothetical protein C8Q77DRAFT_1058523 [Trametes polyzona]|nr:hypothetical protein C8Q77DRAFT_1058523 [Trametes polyzona]